MVGYPANKEKLRKERTSEMPKCRICTAVLLQSFFYTHDLEVLYSVDIEYSPNRLRLSGQCPKRC
jgi:hypothetical protein